MSRLVALTGATGFVGNALLHTLVQSGFSVRALSRRSMPESPGVEWIYGDLFSDTVLESLVKDTEAVIHCAGRVRGKDAAEFLHVNASGTAYLLAACQKQQNKPRFLLISSLAAREPELSWYAHSKRQAEDVLSTHADGMSWCIFRPTAIYGPGDKELKPLLKAMKLGVLPLPNSDSGFTLLHINDLVSAIHCWLNASSVSGTIYELDDGTARGYNRQALIELVKQIWGNPVISIPVPLLLLNFFATVNLGMASVFHYAPMLTPGKVREISHPDWSCDISTIRRDLDWQPAIQLAEAMRNPALLEL